MSPVLRFEGQTVRLQRQDRAVGFSLDQVVDEDEFGHACLDAGDHAKFKYLGPVENRLEFSVQLGVELAVHIGHDDLVRHRAPHSPCCKKQGYRADFFAVPVGCVCC